MWPAASPSSNALGRLSFYAPTRYLAETIARLLASASDTFRLIDDPLVGTSLLSREHQANSII